MAQEKRKHSSEKLLSIRNYIVQELKKISGVTIHTPEDKAAPHIINASARGLKGEVLVHSLAEEEIIISTTSACSSRDKTPSGTLKAMGVSDEESAGAVRISLSYENTIEEAEKMVHTFQQTVDRLYKVMRRNK